MIALLDCAALCVLRQNPKLTPNIYTIYRVEYALWFARCLCVLLLYFVWHFGRVMCSCLRNVLRDTDYVSTRINIMCVRFAGLFRQIPQYTCR